MRSSEQSSQVANLQQTSSKQLNKQGRFLKQAGQQTSFYPSRQISPEVPFNQLHGTIDYLSPAGVGIAAATSSSNLSSPRVTHPYFDNSMLNQKKPTSYHMSANDLTPQPQSFNLAMQLKYAKQQQQQQQQQQPYQFIAKQENSNSIGFISSKQLPNKNNSASKKMSLEAQISLPSKSRPPVFFAAPTEQNSQSEILYPLPPIQLPFLQNHRKIDEEQLNRNLRSVKELTSNLFNPSKKLARKKQSTYQQAQLYQHSASQLMHSQSTQSLQPNSLTSLFLIGSPRLPVPVSTSMIPADKLIHLTSLTNIVDQQFPQSNQVGFKSPFPSSNKTLMMAQKGEKLTQNNNQMTPNQQQLQPTFNLMPNDSSTFRDMYMEEKDSTATITLKKQNYKQHGRVLSLEIPEVANPLWVLRTEESQSNLPQLNQSPQSSTMTSPFWNFKDTLHHENKDRIPKLARAQNRQEQLSKLEGHQHKIMQKNRQKHPRQSLSQFDYSQQQQQQNSIPLPQNVQSSNQPSQLNPDRIYTRKESMLSQLDMLATAAIASMQNGTGSSSLDPSVSAGKSPTINASRAVSPNGALLLARQAKRKEEYEEEIQTAVLCESLSQPIMEGIIQEIQTGEHDFVVQSSGGNNGNGSDSSGNVYNLAFLMKKFYSFCCAEAAAEVARNSNSVLQQTFQLTQQQQQQSSQQQASKLPKNKRKNAPRTKSNNIHTIAAAAAAPNGISIREARVEDMDSNFQNLVLSEFFLERARAIISGILFTQGVRAAFSESILSVFDRYSRFFIPTNNVKRIGLHNIEALLIKVLMSLTENQLIDRVHLVPNHKKHSNPLQRKNALVGGGPRFSISSISSIAPKENELERFDEEINEDTMKDISDFVMAMLNEHTEAILAKTAEYKQSSGGEEISMFDFFMLKQIVHKLLQEMNFEQSSANIILEKIEGVRLLFFRNAKHASYASFLENGETLIQFRSMLAKNKFLLETIGEANVDAFVKFIDSFLLGYRDYANIRKLFPIKGTASKEFFMKLMQEFEEIIPKDLFRREALIFDIEHQFRKIMHYLAPQQAVLSDSSFGQGQLQQQQYYSKAASQAAAAAAQASIEAEIEFHKSLGEVSISDSIDALIDSIEYEIVTNEIPPEISEQDILVNSKFLNFFLNFTFANRGLAFSYYDLEAAFGYFKMSSSNAFDYWVQSLSTIINESHPKIKENMLQSYLNQFMLLRV